MKKNEYHHQDDNNGKRKEIKLRLLIIKYI